MIRCARPGPRTSIAALAITLAALAVAVAGGACVIADPPSDLPQDSPPPPLIVKGSVVPSPSQILGVWPAGGSFVVPVQLEDPKKSIFYSVFVDYNPLTGEGIDGRSPVESDYQPGTDFGNIRTLHINITTPSPDRCHVVEVVVAFQFKGTNDARNLHSPNEQGGDSVNWFFNPSGDLAGCPVLDAGIQPLPLDGGGDGGSPP
jgi:hypothetical protein